MQKVIVDTKECFGCAYFIDRLCEKPKNENCGDGENFYHFKRSSDDENNQGK